MPAPALKLYSWNVNGLRSVISKGAFDSFLADHAPDILCLQEVKLSEIPQPDLLASELYGYPHWTFHIGDKPGYSGTAVLSRRKPLAVMRDFPGEHPREGRVLALEFAACHVVCAYVPNAQNELTRLDYRIGWDADFRTYLATLNAKKPVLLCGDLNCAHNPIDLENPERNRRCAGFTDEERASFSTLLAQGFADTFREKNPDVPRCYSWWSYRSQARERNVGWRIDYWLAARALDGKWREPAIHANVGGSDHCPVSLLADAELF